MSVTSPITPWPLTRLDGAFITGWSGLEMALDGGNAVVTDETAVTGFFGDTPVVWEHPDVPYRQFVSLEIEVDSGVRFQLFGDDSIDGSSGLLLMEVVREPVRIPETVGEIYRTRTLGCLPTGTATLTVLGQSTTGAITDVALNFEGQVLRLIAGEVHPRQDGTFHIAIPDESVLVQLNGARPDPAS
ncbi:hypothetical protein [Mitsuaria sp. GD03876]|uniref:hypothetical protein n=1 Tax=Mitsuaria sp. GD03876 TaxID=2975399 RepID=UPI00244AC953|nr:hypothetical protein [Mitsuaria sp. GD03876]MDH0865091.1 hypothetical protein [Mitsuaria sp. GD03876]MDH0865097.1 hypothetical protein [Mitsuaria sp. GD03876]